MATPRRTTQPRIPVQEVRGLTLSFPRNATAPWQASNLPLDLSSFVGRDHELRELRGLARAHRLVTFTGAGGVGKSRLAIRLAEERATRSGDAAWLVDLATVSDSGLVPSAIAASMGIQETPGFDRLQTLTAALSTRELLLVLDNCEHVLEGAATSAAALLRGCAGVRILATSRQPLRVDGEVVWVAPPLSTPPTAMPVRMDDLIRYDAAMLFLERARAARPDFALRPENAGSVTEICRQLDGLPLALELAAARLRGVGIAQIVMRLDSRFDLLTRGARSASARHQTLRAMVDWSHELLTEDERVLFRRLAVFSGGWTLEAAEAICAEGRGAAGTLETLANLVDHSLVLADDWGGHSRYRFLETIRHYALERLHESGEADSVRARHRDWCAALVAHDDPGFANGHQAAYLNRIDAEIDNIRSALSWSTRADSVDPALTMATDLLMFWHSRGLLREASEWLNALLEVSDSSPGRVLSYGLGIAAYLAFMQGDPISAERYATQELECATQSGDPFSLSASLMMHGGLARFRGEFDAAREKYEAALAMAQENHCEYIAMASTYHLAELARLEGDYDRAVELYGAVRELCAPHGDDYNRCYAVFGLGHIAYLRGDVKAATEAYHDALAIWQDLRDSGNMRWALEGLAWCASAEGRAQRAARLLGAAETLGQRLGAPLVPHFLADHDRAVARTSTDLGVDAYSEQFSLGRGLSLESALCEALESDTPSADGGASASWDPLTERERDVAQLVANGLSNRSIAETLVLGTRTVESHISRILSKLRLSSRAQLAVWADKRMGSSGHE